MFNFDKTILIAYIMTAPFHYGEWNLFTEINVLLVIYVE